MARVSECEARHRPGRAIEGSTDLGPRMSARPFRPFVSDIAEPLRAHISRPFEPRLSRRGPALAGRRGRQTNAGPDGCPAPRGWVGGTHGIGAGYASQFLTASEPPPGWQTSNPLPPSIRSFPVPDTMWSFPVPPASVFVASPPSTQASPALPLTTASPGPAQ